MKTNSFIKKTLLILSIISTNSYALESKKMTVYKSPFCGCCTSWTDIMKKKGFDIIVIKTNKMNDIKKKVGVKSKFASCHTAIIDGYFIEGHVNYSSIKKLLKEKPKNVVGISVPGMPLGSPGMEQNNIKHKYNVISIKKDGSSSIYEKH